MNETEKDEQQQQDSSVNSTDLLGNWLPIETAPKDGTELLLWQKGVGCGVSWWGYDADNQETGWFRFSPSHWMNLPSAPNPELNTERV